MCSMYLGGAVCLHTLFRNLFSHSGMKPKVSLSVFTVHTLDKITFSPSVCMLFIPQFTDVSPFLQICVGFSGCM